MGFPRCADERGILTEQHANPLLKPTNCATGIQEHCFLCQCYHLPDVPNTNFLQNIYRPGHHWKSLLNRYIFTSCPSHITV